MPERAQSFSLQDVLLILLWFPFALTWALRPVPLPEGETVGGFTVFCALASVAIVARQCSRLWGWDKAGGTIAFKLGLGLFVLFAVIDLSTIQESRLRVQQVLSQLNFLLFAGVVAYGGLVGLREGYTEFLGKD